MDTQHIFEWVNCYDLAEWEIVCWVSHMICLSDILSLGFDFLLLHTK